MAGRKRSGKTAERIPAPRPVPSARSLFALTWRQIIDNGRLFGSILLVHLALYAVFVRLTRSIDTEETRMVIESVLMPEGSSLLAEALLGVTTLGQVATAIEGTAAVYAFFIGLIVVLAYVYAFRMVHADKRIPARQAFYQGMYPLVPVLLLLAVVAVQLLPLNIGLYLVGSVLSTGVALRPLELFLVFLIGLALALVSGLLITRGITALYVATLPNMTPLGAFRSAKGLVRGRRWGILGRIIVLFGVIMIGLLAIILLSVQFWGALTVPLTVIALHAALLFSQGYLYNLYRGLV